VLEGVLVAFGGAAAFLGRKRACAEDFGFRRGVGHEDPKGRTGVRGVRDRGEIGEDTRYIVGRGICFEKNERIQIQFWG